MAMLLQLPQNAPESSDPIRDLLHNSKTIAVVGLSSSSLRPSYGVASYLQSAGYKIVPVNPNESEVLGEKSYARLEDIPFPIDIVDVFRRSDLLPGHLADILAMVPRPRLVWLQQGICQDAFARALSAEGIDVVQDRCTLVEHRRLGVGAVE